MLIKLALRNVKRQFGSYLIYFITVMITIAMMFSVINMVFCSNIIMPPSSNTSIEKDMQRTAVLIAMTIIAAIISLIINKAQLYILRIRKKELGTYKLLGIKNHDIIRLFTAETGIIFAFTFIGGILLGTGFYQGLNSAASRIFYSEYKITGYSLKAIGLTGLLAIFIFFVSTVASAEYLKKNDINTLINGRRKKESIFFRESYLLSTIICLVSVFFWLITAYLIYFSISAENHPDHFLLKLFKGNEDSLQEILSLIIIPCLLYIICPVTVIVFNMAYPRCLIHILMKNKKFKSRKTNSFLLRQLSSASISNSAMFGAVSFLVSVSILMMFFLFNVKPSCTRISDFDYPDRCNIRIAPENSSEAEKIFDSYVKTEKVIKYRLTHIPASYFKSSDISSSLPAFPYSYVKELLEYHGESFKMDENCYMVSADNDEYQRINAPEEIMYMVSADNHEYRWINAPEKIQYKHFEIYYAGTYSSKYLESGMLIVPDSIFDLIISESDEKTQTPVYEEMLYYFKGNYNIEKMEKDLTEKGVKPMYWKDLYVRKGLYEYMPIILVLLFCVIFFLIISMAFIALKVSSEVNSDREKYQKLFCLGTDKNTLRKTLFIQTASVFIFPIIQPVIFSIIISKFIPAFFSYPSIDTPVFSNVTLYSIISLLLIFLIYFTVTFAFINRKILHEKPHRPIL